MNPTRHPSDWAAQLRAINAQFALREEELTRQLVTAQADSNAVRQQLAASKAAAEDRAASETAWQAARRQLELEAEQREAALADQLAATVQTLTALTSDHALLRQALQSAQDRIDSLHRQRHDEALQGRAELSASREREAQLIETCGQLERRGAADIERHRAERTRIESTHEERERAWVQQSTALEAALREQIRHEQVLSSQLREAMDGLRQDIDNSLLFRLTRFGRSFQPRAGKPPGTAARGTAEPIPQLQAHASSTDAGGALHQSEVSIMNPSSDTVGPCATIDELLSRYDKSFVASAYLTVLGRPADQGGLDHHLGTLREGQPKSRVIASLARSPEGQRVNMEVPGLRELVLRDTRRSPSWWRRTFGLALELPTESTRRELRKLDYRLYAIEQSIARQSRQLTDLLTVVQQAATHQPGQAAQASRDHTAEEGVQHAYTAPRVSKLYAEIQAAVATKRSQAE